MMDNRSDLFLIAILTTCDFLNETSLYGLICNYSNPNYTQYDQLLFLLNDIPYDLIKLISEYAKTSFVPLPFWFNKSSSLAIPLAALPYHSMNINISFAPIDSVLSPITNK